MEYADKSVGHGKDKTTANKQMGVQEAAMVVTVSLVAQKEKDEWIIVTRRRTKSQNRTTVRTTSSPNRVRGPVTRNAARRNPELAPPSIYPNQTVPQLTSHEFPVLIAPRARWTKAQKGKTPLVNSSASTSPNQIIAKKY